MLTPPDRREVRVWDPLVRLFHWLVVLAVLLNLFVLEAGEQWHRYIGYSVVALVGMRAIWGYTGSQYARFSSFWPTKRAVLTQWRSLTNGQFNHHIGHSPLGAVMMLSLCGILLLLGATGWLMGTDYFWGENWLEEVHETLSGILQILVAIHILAALFLSYYERVNLVASMIHGKKTIK